MRLRNLTPHALHIHLPDGTVREIPAEGVVPRLAEVTEPADPVDGIPVVRTTFGDVVGWPHDVAADDVVIVNSLIGDHVADRLGLTVYSPDTGPASAIRDAQGRIVGVRRLRRHDPRR